MAEGTTAITNTVQQLAMSPAQPNSRLHALPQELQELIFSFVVIRPSPIPARVHLRDVEVFPDDDDDGDDDDTDSNSSYDNNNSSAATTTTTFTTLAKITPRQPSLSRVDAQTRPTALRIFYTQNTFLFRAHAYAEDPLRNWLYATAFNYAPEARLVRRVLLEMSTLKTCDEQPRLLASSRQRGVREPPQQEHLYRVLVSEKPGDEGVRVRFGADLAVMCGCAMRAAGLIRPGPAERRRYLLDEREISSALDFAQDVEDDVVLGAECQYHFCDERTSTKCPDCGLRVPRQEPLGAFLLERVQREVREVVEGQGREAERQRREAEREAARLARERERQRGEAEREAARLARERERARVEAEREEKVRETERLDRLERERERARVEAENAARWEVQKQELDASPEVLTTAPTERMHSEKTHKEKKQWEAPTESRCPVM